MSIAEQGTSTAVERTLAILEAIAQRDGMTNSQISRKLGIPKSSASYILRTLERRGYVRRDRGSGEYKIGLHVLSLSRGVLRGLDLREAAAPILRKLVERSHLTAHLAILDQEEMVYIDKVEAPGFIKMDTWVGRRMLVHSTGVGKALVAFAPEAERDRLIKEHGLKKQTPKTLAVRSRLLQELEKIRAHGYAVDDEENSVGVRCVAAPIFDAQGKVQASIGVTGTTQQVHKADLPRIAELVKEAARKISQQFDYRSPARRD